MCTFSFLIAAAVRHQGTLKRPQWLQCWGVLMLSITTFQSQGVIEIFIRTESEGCKDEAYCGRQFEQMSCLNVFGI